MPSAKDMLPMVGNLKWSAKSARESHIDDDEYYYYDDDGNYNDPYYNSGDDWAWLSTIDWEIVGTWAVLIFMYVALSFIGPWVWPPFIICLWLADGDLEECSLGVWTNGYRDQKQKCHDREWKDELTDA